MRGHICVFLGLGYLNMLFSSSSHSSSEFLRSFFFTAQQHSTADLHHIFIISWRTFRLFLFLIVSRAAVNTAKQRTQHPAPCMLAHESEGSWMERHPDFQADDTTLQFHQITAN